MTYDEFRADYLRRHPSSIPKRARARHEYGRLVLTGVLLMYLSSAGLSGVHTAPTVYQAIDSRYTTEFVRQAVSIGSFAAVELAIPLSAFMNRAQRLARWVLATSFLIAVIANITSTLNAQTSRDVGAVIVSFALGIGAPLIALMSGEMLVQISASRRTVSAEIDREFAEAMRQLDQVINGQWTQYRKSVRPSTIHPLGNGRMDALPPSTVVQHPNGYVDGQVGRSGAGYARESRAFQNAWAYFEANKAAAFDTTISSLALEARIPGAKKSTIAKARKAFVETHSNGSAVPESDAEEQS